MVSEIASAALAALQGQALVAPALLAAAGGAVFAERLLAGRLPDRLRGPVHGALLLAAVGVGLLLAWQVLFLCDDAFISFRYARNLVYGHGLVWNPGEWVEGYTNFLWTLLLAGAGALGASIPHAALFGDLASMAVALVAVAATVRRAAPAPVIVPFAALALAGMRAFHTFGSSGLETMPVAALVAVALWASTTRAGPLGAGLALIAAAMARPDQLVIAACFGVGLVAEDLAHGEGHLLRRLQLRRYLTFVAPFLLIYVPYFLIRWHVYGDPFPNTYYARSASLAYWRQGLVYGAHFVFTSGALVWFPVLLVACAGPMATRDDTRLRVIAVIALPVFAEYVMRVGGDFMEFRFFVPALPIAAVSLEVALRRWWAAGSPATRGLVGVAGAAALAAAVVPVQVLGPFEKRWHLASEPSFYHVSSVFPLRIDSPYWGDGLKVRETLGDLRPTLASDSIGILGWQTDLPMVDAFGLTNKLVSRKPVGRRGRPGHEKFATPDELRRMGAILDFGDPWGERWRPFTRVSLGGPQLFLVSWDPPWMERIRERPGASLPDLVGEATRVARTAPRARVLEVAGFLEELLRGGLPEALHPLRERLGEVADFEGGLPQGARVTGGGLRVASDRLAGASGRSLLTSLPDADGGVGRLELPVVLDGAELRFALGGTSRLASVALVVDGAEVHRATPSSPGRLSPVSFPLAGLEGRPALVVIDDPDPARDAGLRVDAIHLAPREGDVRGRLGGELPAGVRLSELLREAEELLPAGDPDLERLRGEVQVRFDLDTLPDAARLEGTAFGRGPVAAAVENQSAVSGVQGAGFLDSFHGGDRATGRVILPPFVVPRQPLVVLVGGGSDCERTYVGLEVNGRVVARACGRRDEVLRPALLPGGRFAGREGRVVIVDEDAGPWGHVLADDLIVPR